MSILNFFKNKEQIIKERQNSIQKNIESSFHILLDVKRGINHIKTKSNKYTENILLFKNNPDYLNSLIFILTNKMEDLMNKSIQKDITKDDRDFYIKCYNELEDLIVNIENDISNLDEKITYNNV